MKQYLDILSNVLNKGIKKKNRTGIDTLSITGAMFEHDLKNGFPLLTTKFVSLKNVAVELEFFIKGLSDKKWLQDRGCNIWNEWGNPKKVEDTIKYYKMRADYYNESNLSNMCTLQKYLKMTDDEYTMFMSNSDDFKKYIQRNEMDLGGIYGVNWRNWSIYERVGNKKVNSNDDFTETYIQTKSIDQLDYIINTLKTNPFDRRMIVSSWNYATFDTMALPPCHYSYQILSNGKTVDLLWNQRSVDSGYGLPYNIASYALLLTLIAKEADMIPGKLVGFLADVHIYINHIEQIKKQLKRQPYDLPTITIPDESFRKIHSDGIYNWKYKDIVLENYKHHEKINLGDIAI